ncbi:Uncharacterized mitochondrial protein AtMg00310 [Linum perenne]
MKCVSWEKLCLPKNERGLGFRDFQTFNRALLAKQAWRILQEPELLISHLLKGKYFPNSSLLNAELCPGASWGWRGILVGRDVLRIGYRWQVGSGSLIDPLRDQWIPTHPPSTPFLNMIHFGVEIPGSVLDLMSNQQWNLVKLRNIFSDEIVNSILTIPIPVCEVRDKIIWQLSPSGEYTVQSGYEISREILLRPKELGPTSLVDKNLWEESWNLQIQPKFLFFIWKLLRGIIPVKVELIKRNIQLPPDCPVCGMEDESIDHLFLRCILVSKLGLLCNLPMASFNAPSFVYTWREILKTTPALANSFIIFWWRIWKSRNTVVFEFKQVIPEILRNQFHFQLNEQNIYKKTTRNSTSLNIIQNPKNKIPFKKCYFRLEMMCIQVDCATLKSTGGAIGLFVTDKNGDIIFGGGKSFASITDPFTIESIAVREALLWSLKMGFKEIILMGDAELVKNKVTHSKTLHPKAGAIIQEIKDLICSFLALEYRTIPRMQNKKAHCYARYALSFLPKSSELVNLTLL